MTDKQVDKHGSLSRRQLITGGAVAATAGVALSAVPAKAANGDSLTLCNGLLDRATQIQVMRASAAVVQASLFEGWSALIEDARALGKPVFVSDIPVHREQNPDDATYFNPDSAEELADLIEGAWPHLEPGLDLDREQHARDQQKRLTHDFGCRFADVVGRACRTT